MSALRELRILKPIAQLTHDEWAMVKKVLAVMLIEAEEIERARPSKR